MRIYEGHADLQPHAVGVLDAPAASAALEADVDSGPAPRLRVLMVYSNRSRNLVPAPPIGLSYVASATRDAGHDVRFVDLMVSQSPEAELRDELVGYQPDVVGVSVRNIDNVVAQRVARHLDELDQILATVRAHTQAHIVLGGPAASILGPLALERLDADFVVVGEGEDAFPRLLEALGGRGKLGDIPGLCYRQDGKILSVPPVKRQGFTDSGMERWINWGAYEKAGGTWAIHTKRGCPLGCVYCNYPVMEGHHLRSRDAVSVVDEIEAVNKAIKPRTFEFTDSTFNVPESHAIDICEEILRRKLKVNLSAVGVNPLTVSPRLFDLMKRAGFVSLVISPDTASPTMLKNLHKGFTVEHVRNAAEWARASGIRCTWFFLFGGPGETDETAEETVAFVEKHLNCRRFLNVMMTGIRILPGTDLARHAVETGYIEAGRDLCKPLFYLSPEMDETKLIQRINKAIRHCPTIVHGAEQSGSKAERWFNQTLNWLGVPPPYYRFLPQFLRFPPMPMLRSHSNGVVRTTADLRQ